jgi:AraC family transcriptional regulator of adaptative response / DNA-3-methyladenine glycosylase II
VLQDPEACYRAVAGRDRRFDGRLYVGVTSTGIYCRPSCPARTPRPENVRYYASSAAAVAAGFRACRRCRPDALPGSRAWDHRGDLAARALRLIGQGAVDDGGVRGLAATLHVSERHLNRVLVEEVGAGPLALAVTRRAQTARLLVDQTDLTMAEIAFASGFASIRQFNAVMREQFGVAPSALRGRSADDGRRAAPGRLILRLACREPYATDPMLDWLGARAVPGVEQVGPAADGAGRAYRRALRLPGSLACVELAPVSGGWAARLDLIELAGVRPAVAALRRLLDLDADPAQVDEALAADAVLRPLVRLRPGLRVPGAADGFETAVKAVLGQQVSIAAARTLAGRLAAACGEALPGAAAEGGAVDRAFPAAAGITEDALGSIGLTGSRSRTLLALADAVAGRRLDLSPAADRSETRRALLALPGIGPWTAEYIALRALGDPDAWPGTDLVLAREVVTRGADPSRWRPFRGYAAQHLWAAAASDPPTGRAGSAPPHQPTRRGPRP